jgi:singapore isolate B (sub-type 7) whole genome shotgun sequence assembly, scaffold_7
MANNPQQREKTDCFYRITTDQTTLYALSAQFIRFYFQTAKSTVSTEKFAKDFFVRNLIEQNNPVLDIPFFLNSIKKDFFPKEFRLMLDPNNQNAGGEETKKTISDAFLLRKREVIAYYEELLKIALQSNTPTKLMTIAEFAEYLSISQDTARELIKTNKIPYYALSERGFRISVTALNTFLAAKKSNKIAVTSEIDGNKSFTAIRDARANQKAQRQAQQPQKPSNTSTKQQQEQQKKNQGQTQNQQKDKPNNQQNNNQNKPQNAQNQAKPKPQKQQQIGENQRKNSAVEAEKEKKDDFVMPTVKTLDVSINEPKKKQESGVEKFNFDDPKNIDFVGEDAETTLIDAPKEQEEEKDLKNKPTENTGKASNDAPLEQSESTKSEDEKPKIDLEELNAKPIPTVNALTITEAERQLDEALKAQAEGKSTPDEKQEKPEKPQKKARKKNVEVFGADLTIDDMMVEVEKAAKEEPESADNKDVQAEEKFNFDTEEEQKEVEKSNETNGDGDLDSENYAEKPIEEDVKATRKESKNTANEELDDADIAKSIAQELSNRSSEEASNNADVEPFDFSDDDFDEDSIITPVTSAPHTENSVMEAQKEQKEENNSFDIIKENADEESDGAKKEPKAAKKHRPLIKYNTKE